MEVANIEKYMPTVYQAEILVKNNLETYRRQGIKAFKIIHGYRFNHRYIVINVFLNRLLITICILKYWLCLSIKFLNSSTRIYF